MSLLLGLVVAASFGSGDFLGGVASKRARTGARCSSPCRLCALVGAIAVAAIAGGDPHGGDFAFGALGGVLNVAALGCLYQGLAVGRAGLVAPIAAVVGSVIPVVWGLASGENPATAALVGVVLAVVAGGLISVERPRAPGSRLGRPDRARARTARRCRLRVLVRLLRQHARRVGVLAGARRADRRGDRGGARRRRPPHQPRAPRDAPGCRPLPPGCSTSAPPRCCSSRCATGCSRPSRPSRRSAPAFTVGHAWWYLRQQPSTIQIAGLVIALTGLVLIAVSATS